MYWLSGYSRRKKITVYLGHVNSNLPNFPLCVKINEDSEIGAVCRADGHDLRFCAADGRLLKFGCETFEKVDGKVNAVYWVKIDVVKPSTYFYVYYGNTNEDATDQESVWEDYYSVWHLASQAGGGIYDSTQHHYNGLKSTATTPADVLGKVYVGQSFDGACDITFSDLSNIVRPLSIECWLKANTQTDKHILKASTYDNHFLIYTKDGDKVQFRVSASDEFGFTQTLDDAWHQLVFTIGRDGTRRAYWDGLPKELNGYVVGVLSDPSTSTSLVLGDGFTGVIDEVRIRGEELSSDYVKFLYYNINESDNDLLFGAEELGYGASGGVTISSSPFHQPDYSSWYSVDQGFNWSVVAYVGATQPFKWNVGDIPMNWYQINGGCTYAPELNNCAVTGINSGDGMCRGLQGQRYQAIVAGRGLDDACAKLKQDFLTRPIKWKIQTIKRYSRPVYSEATESQCDVLVDESWCEVPECFEFCLSTDEVERIGVSVTGSQVWLHNASGGVRVGGTATAGIAPFHWSGSGGVSVGGAANVHSTAWKYTASDNPLITSGKAAVTSTAWHTSARGGVRVVGSGFVASPSWHYTASGGVAVSGDADISWRPEYKFISRGIGLYITGKSDLKSRFFWPSGGVVVSGEATYERNPKYHVASGGVSVGGHAHVVCSKAKYTASGGVTLRSRYTVGLKHDAVGGVVAGGAASYRVTKAYNPMGGVSVVGSARCISPVYHYTASGGVVVAGEAEYSSNNVGTFSVFIGCVANVSDVGPVALAEPPTEPIPVYAVARVNTACGYYVSTQIELRHNLADSNALADFLVKSNQTIPDRIFLLYQEGRGVWQQNLHYVFQKERWDLLFQLECTRMAGDSELGSSIWKFNVVMIQKEGGTIRTTRFATAFDAALAVRQSGKLMFKCSFDTQSQFLESTSAAPNCFFIYQDGIGLFKNDHWRRYTNLSFYVSEVYTSPWWEEVALPGLVKAPDVLPILALGNGPTTPPVLTAAAIIGDPPIPPAQVAAVLNKPTAGAVKPSPYQTVTRGKPKGKAPTYPPFTRKGGQEKPTRIFNT